MEVFTQFFWTFLQKVLELSLPILAVAFATLISAWIKEVIVKIQGQLSDKNRAILQEAVDLAVQCAEQLDLDGVIVSKKDEAIKIAQTYLDSHKVKIDLAVLDAAIEAAVYNNFNVGKEKSPEAIAKTEALIAKENPVVPVNEPLVPQVKIPDRII